MFRIAGLLTCILLFLIGLALAETSTPWTCTENDEKTDECFWVHGRMFLSNGTPSIRIWIVGTKLVLGVSGESMNDVMEKHLSFESRLYGDFVVCPLSEFKPGHMQSVCVETGSNLVVERFTEGEEKREVFKLKETWKK
jgi:hypothetical protein